MGPGCEGAVDGAGPGGLGLSTILSGVWAIPGAEGGAGVRPPAAGDGLLSTVRVTPLLVCRRWGVGTAVGTGQETNGVAGVTAACSFEAATVDSDRGTGGLEVAAQELTALLGVGTAAEEGWPRAGGGPGLAAAAFTATGGGGRLVAGVRGVVDT